jgi:hypothetical protein
MATCRQWRLSACSQFSARGRQGYENSYAVPLPFWSAAYRYGRLVVVKVLELVEMVLGHADNDDAFWLSTQYRYTVLYTTTSTTKSEGPHSL